MRGIILAGGNGTRLGLSTKVTNKHLLPIFNKPMILYPIETLKSIGVTDILLITGGNHLGGFMELLGDGSNYGIRLTYKIQKEAGGIAQALSLGKDFVDGQFVVILGDNIFEYAPLRVPDCGLILKKVKDPQRFGVYHEGRIEEKPSVPKSKLAVTGLYFYTPEIFNYIKTLEPSARGELEITSVNNWCLDNLPTRVVEYLGFWSDAGTPESLLAASNFIYEKSK